MSRKTLRIVILLAAISISGILVIQVYWVRRAFDLRENQFNRDVSASLRSVAMQLYQINHAVVPQTNPVVQLSSNYFTVDINAPIDSRILGFLIETEFKKRNISDDYEYATYDCMEQCMKGGKYISTSKTGSDGGLLSIPVLDKETNAYYFAVQFPHLEATLISQMGIWIFSSVVLLIVIFFFVYTLFVILKQRKLSEVQKDFINNMTHEFKTPISTIAISSEVLKQPSIVETPERLLNYATIIQTENNRLKQQVERVLQMAQLEKQDIHLKREKCDVHHLINEATKNINLSADAKQAKINLQLQAETRTLFVDKLHLTNIIFNLVDNALKYSVQLPIIFIKTYCTHKFFTVEVADNGIGISIENQKKIFDRFYRVSTGNLHDVKGFGLGLSYVRLMAEAHGGKVSVKSNEMGGSTFIVNLPLV